MSEVNDKHYRLPCPMEDAAEEFPGGLALLGSRGSYTYREYTARVAATAHKLEGAGLGPGEVLGIVLPLSEAYPIVLMACFRAGLIACPLNPRLPVEGMREALTSVCCKAILTSDDHARAVAQLGAATLSLEDLITDRQATELRRAPVRPDQPAVIVFTSGSAGRPKGALLTYGNLYSGASWSNEIIKVQPGDRWLLSLPLYHVAGIAILFRCLLGGGAVVVAGPGEDILDVVRIHGVTHLSLVSAQLHRLLEADPTGHVLRELKAILVGGGPTPERLIRRAASCDLPLHTTYGLTEMASQVTTTRKGDGLDALLTSGRPLRPDTIGISDEGEVLVRGESLFSGYVQGDALDLPLTEGGWFATGDLGRFDANGNLHVAGRKDNMFISGGENIQPEEIEQHLCRLTGILWALVVPIDDAELGSIPVAFVEMEPGAILNVETLARALGAHLPPFKILRAFFPRPRDLHGVGIKVNRKAFAARAAELMQSS